MLPLLLALACATDPGGGPADPTPGDGEGSADGGGGDGGDGGTAGDGGTDDTGDFCADAPLVNYATFGQGFMSTHCQGCHASTAPNRYGAPEDVVFDTVQQVWEHAPYILLLTVGEDPAMPPAGGVTPDDQTRLEWWLRCAEPGT